ncbi:hypothetical protein B0T16DRAFT_462376 [Cercophora newfieldiana]|uniref:Uncharacterized protein n=1 Tax=Cercophora newfieldiana TaxID=92897 RepID=A0AA39XQZ7_9PEZI|nr:hypothetical protein B0T16DRAFT_462376 [Cercophora newfieldiana]
MKLSLVWLAALSAVALAAPAEPATLAPASEAVLDRLMKRDCGGSCKCTGATGSQCFDSCDCQTACCDDKSRLCRLVVPFWQTQKPLIAPEFTYLNIHFNVQSLILSINLDSSGITS